MSNATQIIQNYVLTPTGSQNAAVTYNSATQWLATAYTGVSSYFSNAYSADCGAVTTCTLFDSDCTTAHSTRAKIVSNALSVTQNVEAGYSVTLCVKCENSVASSVQINNWVLTQNRNCATQLVGSINGSPLVDQTVAYVNSATLVSKSAGFADFFTPLYTATCGTITACEIKASGCSGSYSAGNLAIDSAGVVTAKQNIDAGYEDTVCISCSNAHGSSVTHDTWKVT